jgi:hypothetical protein
MYLSSDLLHCHANFSSRGKSTTAIAVDLRSHALAKRST